MTTNTIPEPTLEQQYTDLAYAHGELNTARMRYFYVSEAAKIRNPLGFKSEVSVFYAKVLVDSAELRLNHLNDYYKTLDLASRTAGPATTSDNAVEEPPTNIRAVIEISDSEDEEPRNGPRAQSSSPGPAPAYSSWPPTPPHFYAAALEERQAQIPAIPSTPTRRSRDDGGSSQLLIPRPSAPATPATPSRVAAPAAPATPSHVAASAAPATPATPSHVAASATPATPATPSRATALPITIVGSDGVLTSPNPQRRHYIVTRGRRTGIYRSWPEAHGFIDGLGPSGAWQGFDTYREAFDAYMGARERGFLAVVRLPGDTAEVYGAPKFAEDL